MNKMKVFFLSLVLYSLPFSSFSDQVKINIIAKVIAKTCSVSPKSSSLQISLVHGDLRGVAVGVPFSFSPFEIRLNDCPSNINSANIIFNGESDNVMPDLLLVTGDTASKANGIALGIFRSDKTIVDIRNNSTTFPVEHEKNETSLSFLAAYVKTSDAASPGKVTSFVNFDITYD